MPNPETALKDFTAVIITGGSSGIGKSFIDLLGKLRPDLAFCNLSRRKPDMGYQKLNLRHIPCDLSRPEQVDLAVAGVRDFLALAPPGKALLINNSGFGVYGSFPEPGTGQQVEMVDVNVRSVVQMTGALLPDILRRGGVIMTVASTAAFQPTPYIGVYGATKAFVLHWSLALNEELRGTGVSALAVCPGPTSTEFFVRAGLEARTQPDSFGQTPDEVAVASLQAMAAGKSMVVCGWRNRVMAALASLVPKPLVARMAAAAISRYRMGRVRR